MGADKIIDAVFGSITLPKSLVIHNRRLGGCLRFMQLAAVIYVLVNIIIFTPWYENYEPISKGVEMWARLGDTVDMQASNVAHCLDPASFQYTYQAGDHYLPSQCLWLPEGESFVKAAGTLWIMTYAQDRQVSTDGGTLVCSSGGPAESACSSNGGSFNRSGLTCSCQGPKEEFFVQNAEETVVFLNHGYQVNYQLWGRSYSRYQTSRAKSASGRDISSGKEYDHDVEIETIILKPNGDECGIGTNSKSVWSREDARSGINAPLKDWLSCGGVSLDTPEESMRTNDPAETSAPRPRITGAAVTLTMSYHNFDDRSNSRKKRGKVTCYMTVAATPQWNSMTSIAYSDVPTGVSDHGQYRYRYAYGVSVAVQAYGSFSFFDYNALITFIVAQLIILSIPNILIELISLNLVGLMSKVYKRAANQPLQIERQFPGLCARLMSAATSFDQITESTTGQLSAFDLEQRMRQVFHREMQDGTLDENEIKKLTRVVLAGADAAGTGALTLDEFLLSCSSNETVSSKEASMFFDSERKIGLLERVFADRRGVKNSASTSKVHPEGNAEMSDSPKDENT